jgi:hypothetical protein
MHEFLEAGSAFFFRKALYCLKTETEHLPKRRAPFKNYTTDRVQKKKKRLCQCPSHKLDTDYFHGRVSQNDGQLLRLVDHLRILGEIHWSQNVVGVKY